jgi:hypothetical protein
LHVTWFGSQSPEDEALRQAPLEHRKPRQHGGVVSEQAAPALWHFGV